jgi:hypothetical protein
MREPKFRDSRRIEHAIDGWENVRMGREGISLLDVLASLEGWKDEMLHWSHIAGMGGET